MLQEDLEKVVLYSNICLKRWKLAKRSLGGYDDVNSLIKSWLCKIISQHWLSSANARQRKIASRSMLKSMFFTTSEENGIHITSLDLRDGYGGILTESMLINYDVLNLKAIEMLDTSPVLYSVNQVMDGLTNKLHQIKFA